jgi:hypothetical protein
LSSWLRGLNTTLGQTFFENVAHHISDGEKREYTSGRLGNLQITQSHRNHISQIIADLSTSTKVPDLTEENKLILQDYDDTMINANDFSADIFIQENDSITAIEIKSVKPNSGEMKGEKLKILEGKAALYRKFPTKKIHFYIGFPFDPTINPDKEHVTEYDKTRFLRSIINMNKYFDPDETLLASEFWDFLSGQKHTMEQILEIINTIATPEFKDKFNFLRNNENRNKKEYKNLLDEWFLYSEKELIVNDEILKEALKNKKRLTKIYNKQPFDNKGNYLFSRYNELFDIIK